jgi:hypothetical protein
MSARAFAAAKHALQADSSVEVRRGVLSNLWQARQAFPQAERLVEQAASDPAKEVREAAALLLGKAPQSQ